MKSRAATLFALLIALIVVLPGCTSASDGDPLDAGQRAMDYTRALLEMNREALPAQGTVDVGRATAVSSELRRQVGSDVSDMSVMEQRPAGEGRTRVDLELRARDGRNTVLGVVVITGTGKVDALEVAQ